MLQAWGRRGLWEVAGGLAWGRASWMRWHVDVTRELSLPSPLIPLQLTEDNHFRLIQITTASWFWQCWWPEVPAFPLFWRLWGCLAGTVGAPPRTEHHRLTLQGWWVLRALAGSQGTQDSELPWGVSGRDLHLIN